MTVALLEDQAHVLMDTDISKAKLDVECPITKTSSPPTASTLERRPSESSRETDGHANSQEAMSKLHAEST